MEGKERQRQQTALYACCECKISICCDQVRVYVLLTMRDGSEAGVQAPRSRSREGTGCSYGLVDKIGCPQMHEVFLSAKHSAGKGDEVSQQGKAAADLLAPCGTM